jgi:hypothetical protein
MMFADFIHFYGYTADQALSEYAKRFFGLANSMYRIKGVDSMNQLVIASNAASGGDGAQQLMNEFKRQAKGNQGILEEVRVIKK